MREVLLRFNTRESRVAFVEPARRFVDSSLQRAM
jgi:hypothetical protein